MDNTYQSYWLRAYREAQLLNLKAWQNYSFVTSSASIRQGRLELDSCNGFISSTSQADVPNTAQSISVMVAPFCAMNKEGEYLAPLWLPARLLSDGTLLPRYQGINPFIPTRFFNPSVEGPKFGSLLAYDNYLNSQAVLQAPISEDDWQTLYIRGYHCLNDIAGDWINLFGELGYEPQNHGLVYQLENVDDEISRILNSNSDNKSAVLNRWFNPEAEQDYQNQIQYGQDADVYHHLLGCMGAPQSDSLRQILLQVSQLQTGDILSVAHPKGCHVDTLLDNLFANTCIESLSHAIEAHDVYGLDKDRTSDKELDKKLDTQRSNGLPTLLVGTSGKRALDKLSWLPSFVSYKGEWDLSLDDNARILGMESYLIQAVNQFKDSFFNQYGLAFATFAEYTQFLKQKFNQELSIYHKGADLFAAWVKATTDPKLQSKLKAFQDEDEKLESEFEHLEKAKEIWQKKGAGHPWWMGLSFISSINKKRQARFQSFVLKCLVRYEAVDLALWKEATEENVMELIQNRLRTIRARRTKLHVELVPVTEAIVAAGANGRAFHELMHQTAHVTTSAQFEEELGQVAGQGAGQGNGRGAAELGKSEQTSRSQIQDISNVSYASFSEMHEKRDALRKTIFELAFHCKEAIWLHETLQAYENKDSADVLGTLDSATLVSPLSSYEQRSQWLSTFTCVSHPSKVDLSKHYAKVIILDAHRYLPFELVGLLNVVDKAVFIGDVAGAEPLWPIPGHIDEDWALRYGLNTEEWDFEVLQFKGGLTSSGNAYLLSRDVSSFKEVKESHLLPEVTLGLKESLQHPKIAQYANNYVYSGKIEVLRTHSISDSNLGSNSDSLVSEFDLPVIGYVPVNGQSQEFAGNLFNEEEVNAIVGWLVSHKLKSKDYYVLTPFAHQAFLIKNALRANGLDANSVYVISEVPSTPRKIVLFSSVHTPKDVRPFCLDQGEQIFNLAFGSALSHILFFGEMMLFDPDTHSPSGQVAKSLFMSDESNEQGIIGGLGNAGKFGKSGKFSDLATVNSKGVVGVSEACGGGTGAGAASVNTSNISGSITTVSDFAGVGSRVDWAPPITGEIVSLDKGALSKLFTKAKDDIWIYSEKTAKDFLKRVEFDGVLMKVARGELSIHLVTTPIDASLQKKLLDAGFHLHIMPRLFVNLIVVDDHTYITIPYSLFAESDELMGSRMPVRAPKGMVKALKQNLLDNLKSVSQQHFVKKHSVVES